MSNARIVEILETLAPVTVAPADYTTTDAYADVTGSALDSYGKTRIVYVVTNEHAANSITWKVLASLDNITFVEVQAEATLAAVTTASWVADTADSAYRYFKVQAKATVAESQGTVALVGYAKM